MWRQRSPHPRQFALRWTTTWPARTANQVANGWLETCPEAGEKWPAKLVYFGSSDRTASEQSGRAASACRHQMGAEQLKTGRKSPPRFSKKWASTNANMPGRLTATHIRTTTSTSGCAGSEVTECYGIRSTARSGRSRHAPSWRLNLT